MVFNKGKGAVIKALKIRRMIKIFFSFTAGISTAIYSYTQLYEVTQHRPISVYYAILAGAATTAFALLFMEIIRSITGGLKKTAIKLLDKLKKRNEENKKNGKKQDK